jgi:hypothetical protein
MKFEWDEAKNERNIKKHGLDFAEAVEVFNGPILERLDDSADYGEERWVAVGLLHGIVCVVLVYTEPDRETIRIISFRKADRYEREAYFETFAHRLGESHEDDGRGD